MLSIAATITKPIQSLVGFTNLVVILVHSRNGTLVANPQVNGLWLVSEGLSRQLQKWLNVRHQARKFLPEAIVLSTNVSGSFGKVVRGSREGESMDQPGKVASPARGKLAEQGK